MLLLHFLNVENGDCTIVEYNDGTHRRFGVIDCNRTRTRKSPALDKLKSLGAADLEFVCITHPDKDHYAGISDVLDYYQGKIASFMTFPLASVLTDQERLKKYAKKVLALANLADDEDIANRHLELVQILKHASENFLPDNWIEVSGDFDRLGVSGFGPVEFYGISPPKRMRGQIAQMVLDPNEIATVNNNEISVAIEMHYAGRRIVLGGDSVDENWEWHRKYRAKVNATIASNVVKLPHHGSRYDNSPETLDDFFDGIDDSIAIISAGGRIHPDFETIEKLQSLPCTRLCTNLFNPDERALKRIYNNGALTSRLRHYLNVYASPLVARPTPCKGDIVVSISPDGAISSQTEYNTVCGCTKSFSASGLPTLPSTPAIRSVP
ncbi:beta-lactamase superfamily II metal-dependent hydrolase [Sinorhizobium terangae]|uniref:MBL fold metallo-hydrolase n=1 Tax=Sinorhizobium terangae TaxID=110322 RepID=A0A6N7LKU2_SINTE|nr:hypothetical protein [Sinorhizobium terangae]MBB4189184.1 beta-lactamase superfamily II metal-dependent hydrolase [Sinorhizobium terangae]MQX18256.1 hypothetical protein [Sinorhizobium terangae]